MDNHTHQAGEDAPHDHANGGVKYTVMLLTLLLSIIGFCVNVLTIIVVFKCPKIRKTTSSNFVLSLSIADACLCAFNAPFITAGFITDSWSKDNAMCTVITFIRYINVGVSLLSVTAISVNRLILIAKPQIYNAVYQLKYVYLMIASCWIISVLLQTPILAGVWGKYGYDSKIKSCSIITEKGKNAKNFMFISAFAIPSVIIIFCYAGIFWEIRQSKLRLKKHAKNYSRNKKKRMQRRKSERLKITLLGLVIYLSFAVCYLPTLLMKLTKFDDDHPQLYVYFGFTFLLLSTCVNPVIYAIMNRKYRRAYLNIFLCNKFSERFSTKDKDKESSSKQSKESEPIKGHVYKLRTLERVKAEISDMSSASSQQSIEDPSTAT